MPPHLYESVQVPYLHVPEKDWDALNPRVTHCCYLMWQPAQLRVICSATAHCAGEDAGQVHCLVRYHT